MIPDIGDSLSDLASYGNGEEGADEDDVTEQDKLSDDDEHGLVMGTLSKTVQQCMVSFPQKQMKLDESTQLRSEDAADYFCKQDKKYGTAEFIIPAMLQPQSDEDTSAPPPTTFGQLMQCDDIVTGISQIPQGTTRPGCSHVRLGLVTPESNTSVFALEPTAETDTSPLLKVMLVEPVCFYRCMKPPANCYIDFIFGRRHAESSGVSRGRDWEFVTFDVIGLANAICLPIFLHVRFFMISVTTL
jgi:hypothetical protein